jgi:hypothetical protein
MEIEVEAYYEVSSQKWQFLVRLDPLLFEQDDPSDWLGYLEDEMRVAKRKAERVSNGS